MTAYNYIAAWDRYSQGFTDQDFINLIQKDFSDNENAMSLIPRWNALLASMPDASYGEVLYYGPDTDTDDGEPDCATFLWWIQNGLTNEWRHFHPVARVNRDASSTVIDLLCNVGEEPCIIAATEEDVDAITFDDVIKSVDAYLTLHNN